VLAHLWQSKKLRGFVALLLWAGSVALGFYTAIVLQGVAFRIYTACCAINRLGFVVVRQWVTIFLLLFWVLFATISIEFHSKHFDRPESWKFFGWSILAMALLLSIALLI
jgi:hypothetical protein